MLVRIVSTVRIAFQRLRRQLGLEVLLLIGVTSAVAFCAAIPLYTNTIYNRLLQTELFDQRRSMPAFALLFRYKGAEHGALQWEDLGEVDAFLRQRAAPALGLPQLGAISYVTTGEFELYPPGVEPTRTVAPHAKLSLGYQSDIEHYITLTQGTLPRVAPEPGVIEVLISEQLQQVTQWEVGQTYTAVAQRDVPHGIETLRFAVRLAGVWQPKNRDNLYWFYNPERLPEDLLLVTDEIYAQQLAGLMEDEVHVAMWYLILDGDAFRPAQADAFLRRLATLPQRVDTLLPHTSLMAAPADAALREYQAAARWLTVTLFAFGVPVFASVIVFVNYIAGLLVQRQMAEVVILRSRGATQWQLLGMAGVQGAVLACVAAGLGLFLGQTLAGEMSGILSFLNFSGEHAVRPPLDGPAIALGAAVAALTVVAMVAHTGHRLGHTIVSYRQEQGRMRRRVWWLRGGVDLILLAIAAYGAYLLRMQGSLGAGGDESALETLTQNPLLFAVPALSTLALALVGIRILPVLAEVVAQGLSWTPGVAVVLAVRQVSRSLHRYTAPLVLLGLSLSLAVFTSSLAKTLDNHARDQAYQAIGADMRLEEVGENTEIELDVLIEKLCITDPALACPWEDAVAAEAWIEEMGLRDIPRWRFLPVQEHLKAPGVEAATRVGWYEVSRPGRQSSRSGAYIGIDRAEFASVAYWQPEFAVESMGALMNQLAIAPNGVLVSRALAEAEALTLGAPLRLTVRVADPGKVLVFHEVALDLTVAGFLDGFPGWTDHEDPIYVGNLDYLFQEAGGHFPHSVWLRTTAGADHPTIAKTLKSVQFNIQRWDAPEVRVQAARLRPEQQGLLGVLSMGFLIAAGLAVLGLTLYVFFSLQRRTLEVGTLRAIGVSRSQVTALMVWELAFLLGMGALGGTAIGLAVSHGFVPYMQVSRTVSARDLVPMVVNVAWEHVAQVYGVFGLLFAGMVLILILLLRRIRLYEAVTLGSAA